jgi:type IV pilus biogenesis protein CpaD/CtpE
MSARDLAWLALALLAACAETDPYRRSGMWQPEGANAANIAAMVERPSDLVGGRNDRAPETRQARDAVERLWEDRQRTLRGGHAQPATNATGAAATTPERS